MTSKRRIVSQLPQVHQTDVLSKFLGSTADHLFQPGRAEEISAFIGSKPAHFDPKKDFYKVEPSVLRQAYQLDPTMVSFDSAGNPTNILFYDDFVNYLRLNGARTDNHDRLFAGDHYSWAPPVDLDKINNHHQYYWFGDDLDLLPAVHLASHYIETIADGTLIEFALPVEVVGIETEKESPAVFVDGFRARLMRVGDDRARLAVAPTAGAVVRTYRYGDLPKAVMGRTSFDARPFTSEPVELLTSTMKVEIEDAASQTVGWDMHSWDIAFLDDLPGLYEDKIWGQGFRNFSWDPSVQPRTFWVEGVGVDIRLIPLTPATVYNKSTRYVVMDRRCRDRNPWALHNYWVHRDAFTWADLSFPTRRAARPIIEFIPDIELFGYGTRRIEDITATLTGDPRYYQAPFPRALNQISEFWDVLTYDEDVLEAEVLQPISIESVPGKELGSVLVDGQRPMVFGDRILVLESSNKAILHRIITVGLTDSQYLTTLTVSEYPNKGDIVRLDPRGHAPWDLTGWDSSVWDFSDLPVEYVFTGKKWVEVVQSPEKRLDPFFALYTPDRVRHDELPSSTFVGNRLFGYSFGSGTIDNVLGRYLSYDNDGEIVFENDQVTRRATSDGSPIPGFQHYRVVGEEPSQDRYENGWHPVSGVSRQTVDANGIWSIPLNLSANPDHEEVTFISKPQWFPQFSQNVVAQRSFSGSVSSRNNWRDTQRVLGLGREILQHRSPLLKAMLLSSDQRFDLFDAIRFVDREYSRYKNKLLKSINKLLQMGTRSANDPPSVWVDSLLSVLSAQKTVDFPFAFSPVARPGAFVPPTAHALGIFKPIKPHYETDDTYPQPIDFLVGHDGSRTPRFKDFRDDILLEFEYRVYNSAVENTAHEDLIPFDILGFQEGRYRKSYNSNLAYRRDEIIEMYAPIYTRWAQQNNLDTKVNKGFIQAECFTWNIRGVPDIDGNPCPGNWRALYRYFYDTDRPHLAPWEMLGFPEKPDWFEDEYGPAPYTSGNIPLWRDIQEGRIARGVRQGYDERFERPDLFDVLPVDQDGNLRDFMEIGLLQRPPSFQEANRDWEIGDHGPVENLWMSSSSFGFAKAHMSALMRPAEFVERAWDSKNWVVRDRQSYNRMTGRRDRAKDIYVHGEVLSDGSRAVVAGIQQWITDLMASRSQPPEILGSALRGLQVRLSHRVGGFIQSSSLRVFADNLGRIPGEDVTVILHQPPAHRETFYSAIIVEWTGEGFRVVGYDSKDQYFRISVGDEFGPKASVSAGENPNVFNWAANVAYPQGRLVEYGTSIYQAAVSHTSGPKFEPEFWSILTTPLTRSPRVTVASRGVGEIKRVPYGTIFPDIQATASFIRDYFRWLEEEGFEFEEPDDNGAINGWSQAILEFLRWSQMDWSPGHFIALSPGAATLVFKSEFGVVYNTETETNGFYGLIDRSGRPHKRENTFVSRLDETTKIIARNNDVYGARLRIGAIDHAVVFSNSTIFGDVIYDPLLHLRQPRLRLMGFRSTGWRGRLDAPGYALVGAAMLSNFDKASENIRYMFDIEGADDPILRDHARAMIGYLPQPYLENLFISQTEQFEFYQGLIQSKGTPDVLNRLTRSDFIENSTDIRFLEEWALRVGEYGSLTKTNYVSFVMARDDIRFDSQYIAFDQPTTNDGVIGLATDDNRWIDRPDNPDIFGAVTRTPVRLRSAGYVRTQEVDLCAARMDLLPKLFSSVYRTPNAIRMGTRIWVYDTGAGFNVFEAFGVGLNNRIAAIAPVVSTDKPISRAKITFLDPHNLAGVDVGMRCILAGPTKTTPDIPGVWEITDIVSQTEIEIGEPFTTDAIGYTFPDDSSEFPPEFVVLRPMRFLNRTDARNFWRRYMPVEGQMMWVDDAGEGTWAVYRWQDGAWIIEREQPLQVDVSRLKKSFVYEARTAYEDQTVTSNPVIIPTLTIFHPLAGFIPGEARNELTYMCDVDPASYADDGSQWGSAQVGQLWWDLSTAIYLDAEMDRADSLDPVRNKTEIDYRRRYWGQLAPGTSIDVYEWVRSTKSVYDWAEGGLRPANGYSGEPASAVKTEYDPLAGGFVTVHYFWVRNRVTIPAGRAKSAAEVASLILNPLSNGLPTITPITTSSFIVRNVADHLTYRTVLELRLEDPKDDTQKHTEWQIVRPGDDRLSLPESHWQSLKASLVGYDKALRSIPADYIRFPVGARITEGQSMFDTRRLGVFFARSSFVENVNRILARDPIVRDRAAAVDTLKTMSPSFGSLLWTQTDPSATLERPPVGSFDYSAFGLQERDYILLKADWSEFDRKGLSRNPRILVHDERSGSLSWSIWEIDRSKTGVEPSEMLSLAKNYDLVKATEEEMRENRRFYAPGTRILVEKDETRSNWWSVYAYEPGNSLSDPDGFMFENGQTYDTSDFYEVVDWYAAGYSSLKPPGVTYPTISARNSAEGSKVANRFVRVNDDGAGAWVWTTYEDNRWIVVARQASTIALKSRLFDVNANWSFGMTTFDSSEIANRGGVLELRYLFDTLRANILTPMEANELFFGMLHFVHTQQDSVDWAFKTSFLAMFGYNEQLKQTPISLLNNTDNIVSFVEDAKPYRVVVRDLLRTLAPDLDVVNLTCTDFDKPIWFDPVLGAYRKLDHRVKADLAILASMSPWKDWLNNYAGTDHDPASPTFNPVRANKITLKFDRVEPYLTALERTFGWDIGVLERSTFDDSEKYTIYSSSLDRLRSYRPTPGMRKNDPTILFDLDYRGDLLISGGGFGANTLDVTYTCDIDPDVLISGGEFCDAYAPNRPQEFIWSRLADGLSMIVRTNAGLGSPTLKADTQFVSEFASPMASPVSQIADTTLVFKDGSILEQGAFTYDLFSRQVTTPISTGDQTVSARSFGFAGLGAILQRRFFAGDGVTDTFVLEKAPTNLTVLINGVALPASGYSVSGSTVTITPPPTNGDQIVMLDSGVGGLTRMAQEQIAYTGSNTFALSKTTTSAKPLDDLMGTMVYRNGLRLMPPFMRVLDFPSSYPMLFSTPSAAASVEVYVDGIKMTMPVGLAPSGTLKSPFTLVDISNPGDFAVGQIPAIVVAGDVIVVNDASAFTGASKIVVINTDIGDYTLSGSTLTVTAPLAAGDVLEVVTFENVDPMIPETNVYWGSPSGEYAIDSYPYRDDEAYLFVSVDGVTLTPKVDYDLIIVNGRGFDGGSYEYPLYDTFTDGAIVKIKTGQSSTQRVVITTFCGRPASQPSIWTAQGREAGLSLGRGRFEFVEWSETACGALNGSFSPSSETLTFDLNAYKMPNSMLDATAFPDPAGTGHPGRVFIGGESVEYFAREISGNTITLSQLRRRGAPRTEQRVVGHFAGNGSNTSFLLNGGVVSNVVEAFTVSSTGERTVWRQNEHYTLADDLAGVIVTMMIAPALGDKLVLAQSLSPTLPEGELVYENRTGRTPLTPVPFGI